MTVPRKSEPTLSELSRTFEQDGWKLAVEIYKDRSGKWMLQVFDERNTGTHWIEPFDTEQQALDEALKVIEEEGIEAFSESLPYRDH
ncbi:MAG: hypothetical protein A3I02_07530 [Betaproteobacteria bacterium RIFCSPLOWO2_02_FULL_67_26]|nr:MAG: hypothetical protein A3I02_07530 [Betaproteobacteria bacterium RIFCSPLOWO2_02_FULL_67_26]